MIMNLVGKDIIVGLLKQTVDKQVKNDAGVYILQKAALNFYPLSFLPHCI